MSNFFESTDPFYDFFRPLDAVDMAFLLDKKDISINIFKLLLSSVANVITVLTEDEDLLTRQSDSLVRITRSDLLASLNSKFKYGITLIEKGADSLGVDDSTDAFLDAISDAISLDRPLVPTKGIYLIDPTVGPTISIPIEGRFLLDAQGAVLKVPDGAYTADNEVLLIINTDNGDVDRVDIRNLGFDGNRTNNVPPGDFTWQHNALLQIGDNSGDIIKHVSISDLDFKDPVADCIWIPRYYIDTLQIDRVTVRDRAGTRSDITFSAFPRITQISDFIGSKIESEPLTVPISITHNFLVEIDNAVCSEIFDMGGLDDPGDRVTWKVNNIECADFSFIRNSGYIKDSKITFAEDSLNFRRIQYPRDFLFENTDFYIPADSDGVVIPITIFYENLWNYAKLKFRGCRFHLKDEYESSSFTGAALQFLANTGTQLGTLLALTAADNTVTKTAHGLENGTRVVLSTIVSATGVSDGTSYYVINSTTDTFQLGLTSTSTTAVDITADGTATVTWFINVDLTVEDCWFDDRFATSVEADRCGRISLRNNDYAGTVCALDLTQSVTLPTTFIIEGGRWDRVSGNWANIDAAAGGELHLKNIAIPSAKAPMSATSTSQFPNMPIFNNRIQYVSTTPTGAGIRGDRARLVSPVSGQIVEWVATNTHVSGATWKAASTLA